MLIFNQCCGQLLSTRKARNIKELISQLYGNEFLHLLDTDFVPKAFMFNYKENDKMSHDVAATEKIITKDLVFDVEDEENQFKPIKVVADLSNMTYYVGIRGLLANLKPLKPDVLASISNEALYYSPDAQDYVLDLSYIPTLLTTKTVLSSHPFFKYLAEQTEIIIAHFEFIYKKEMDALAQKRIKKDNIKNMIHGLIRIPYGYLTIYEDKSDRFYIHIDDLAEILDMPKFDEKLAKALSDTTIIKNFVLIDEAEYSTIKANIKPNKKFDTIFRFLILNSIPKDPAYNHMDKTVAVEFHKTKKYDIITYYSNGDVYVDLHSLLGNLDLMEYRPQIIDEFKEYLVYDEVIQSYSVHEDIIRYIFNFYITEYDTPKSAKIVEQLAERNGYISYLYKLIEDIKRKSLSKAPKEEEDIYPKIIKDLKAELVDTPYGAITVYKDTKTHDKYIYLRDLYQILNTVSPLKPELFFRSGCKLLDETKAGLFNLKYIPMIKCGLPRDTKRDEVLDDLYTEYINSKPVGNKGFSTKTYCYSNEAFNIRVSMIVTEPDQIFVTILDVLSTLNISIKKEQEILKKYRDYFIYSEELDDRIIHIDNLIHLFEINELPIFYQVKDSIINYLELLLDLIFKFKCVVQNVNPADYFNKSKDLVEFGPKGLHLYCNKRDHTLWILETQLLQSLDLFRSTANAIDNINKLSSLLPSNYIKYFENIGVLLRYDDNTIKAIKKVINNESLVPVLSAIEKAIENFTTIKDDPSDLEDLIDEELDDIDTEIDDTEITPMDLAIHHGLNIEGFNDILYHYGLQYPIEDSEGHEHWILRSKYADQNLVHDYKEWVIGDSCDSYTVKEILSFSSKGIKFVNDIIIRE